MKYVVRVERYSESKLMDVETFTRQCRWTATRGRLKLRWGDRSAMGYSAAGGMVVGEEREERHNRN